MDTAEVFTTILQRNQVAIAKSVEGLTHAESLLQLPGKSNCMNWVIGHIAAYRDGMLADIRQPGYITEDDAALYGSGSAPITVDSKSVSFERLVQAEEKAFEAIARWLQSKPEGLQEDIPRDISVAKGYSGYYDTVAEHFAQNLGHEAIHVGELSALRELALAHTDEI